MYKEIVSKFKNLNLEDMNINIEDIFYDENTITFNCFNRSYRGKDEYTYDMTIIPKEESININKSILSFMNDHGIDKNLVEMISLHNYEKGGFGIFIEFK